MNSIISTSDKPIQLAIRPSNVLGNAIPGVWDKDGPVDWTTESGAISIEPDPNTGGIQATVKSIQPTRKVVALIGYTARIRRDLSDPNGYETLTGNTEVTFAPADMATGLVAEQV